MKRFDVETRYCEKIKEINNMFIEPETEHCYEDCTDNEEYHRELDKTLIDLLKELHFDEVVKLYEKAKNHFWYS